LGERQKLFREFYEEYDQATGSAAGYPVVCTGPIAYCGQAAVQSDIENFQAALAGVNPEEAFIPANEYYPTEEAYLFAIADAMREEYSAIVRAGFLLQIDDPGW
jgi:5-methyltetrahydropteroyltriglutamate--homocysteine methyltransferase